jgi:hypothetical protein
MFLNIFIEIVLATATFILARQFWIVFKRNRFLKSRIINPVFLEVIITREALENPSPEISIYAKPNELGYFVNIHAANAADVASTRRIKLIYAILLVIVFIASYFLGIIYLVINTVVLLLAALSPISLPAKSSAYSHILSIAYILRCWHKKNSTECEKWVEQAWALRPLYDAVKKTC